MRKLHYKQIFNCNLQLPFHSILLGAISHASFSSFSFHFRISIWIYFMVLGTYCIFFIFYQSNMVEMAMLLRQIFKIKLLMKLCVLRSHESKNNVLSGWSVCVRERECVCHQHNSKINYSREFKFSILNTHHTEMLF